MKRIELRDKLQLSRLVHGVWRLNDWNLDDQELLSLLKQTIELGITSFDHADIYGDYSCEEIFGNALRLDPGLRNQMEIITKCGINLLSSKFPERKVKYYDYSYDHIVGSAENSLKNLGTDRIELLLLHRPSPFFDPEEVARAFSDLRQKGKVLNFGVSNFTPGQFEMLEAYCDEPLLTNQVEISPYCLEHFDNGNMDFFVRNKVHPMAWSPLAGGQILSPADEKGKRLLTELEKVTEEINAGSVDKTIYCWLIKHPSGILPILGTSRIDRMKNAVEATHLEMSLEQWFRIYIASLGNEVP